MLVISRLRLIRRFSVTFSPLIAMLSGRHRGPFIGWKLCFSGVIAMLWADKRIALGIKGYKNRQTEGIFRHAGSRMTCFGSVKIMRFFLTKPRSLDGLLLNISHDTTRETGHIAEVHRIGMGMEECEKAINRWRFGQIVVTLRRIN